MSLPSHLNRAERRAIQSGHAFSDNREFHQLHFADWAFKGSYPSEYELHRRAQRTTDLNRCPQTQFDDNFRAAMRDLYDSMPDYPGYEGLLCLFRGA